MRPPGEVPGQGLVLCAEYVDAEGPTEEEVVSARRLQQGDEDERRLERDRSERVDRQPVTAVGPVDRNHCDTRGEPSEAGTELERRLPPEARGGAQSLRRSS